MKGTRAALRYAKALLNLAKEQGVHEEVNDNMLFIANTITESKDLQIMLKSPIIKSEAKSKVLKAIFETHVNELSNGLIQLLIENKRIELLLLTAKEYTIIYDFLMGYEVAIVTSAIPLTPELEKSILEKIKTLSSKEVSIKNIINPEIIGGFVLRLGDVQYDASILQRFQTLKRDFKKNLYLPNY
ncbi:MAG TPA: ATP synthase F1 subunit delta [Flavobacteriaceae bacterium]|jgi:F-type H+-transporting ATPase subunit delta|nr:ATP synthase F1 subunit delta [Flavobacteriaceae bacterium]HEX5743172.1 ATP synthase F1 subunit delta [Flavobacteriaceae bacterium]